MIKLFHCLHLNASQHDLLGIPDDPPPHGVEDGLRLLEDLLVHEGVVVALAQGGQLGRQVGDLAAGLAGALEAREGWSMIEARKLILD